MHSILAAMALIFVANSGVAGTPPAAMPQGHPPITQPPATALPNQGQVVSFIDASIYTYIEVAQGDKTFWLAAPAVSLKKDDKIRFSDGMEMKDFHSKTLDRTFPSIIFVNSVVLDK